MRLTVCMIARDEEEVLPRALESIEGVWDELLLVDTGSGDRTAEIARGFGGTVLEHKWAGDFAEARNAALDRASGDYVFFLDADECLEPRSRPALASALSGGADAYFVRIESDVRSSAGRVYVNLLHRLFKNHMGIRYEGAVHEQVDSSLRRLGARVEMSGIVLKHSGYALEPARLKAKLERNLEILRRVLARSPDEAVSLFHLGETLAMLGESADAVRAYEGALRTGGLPAEMKPVAMQNLASSMIKTGKYREAMGLLRRVQEMDPQMLSPHLLMGSALFGLGKHGRAEEEILTYISRARQVKKPAERLLGFEADIPAAMVLVAKCRLAEGQMGKAVEVLKEAVSMDPHLADGHILLGRIAYEKTDFARAAASFERAVDLLPGEERLHFELARSLVGAGAVRRAREAIERALDSGPASAGLLRCLGIVNIKLEDFEGAISAYERSLEEEPANPEARRMLAGLYRKMGDDESAARHLTICK